MSDTETYETVEIYRNSDKLATVAVSRDEWSAIAWVDYLAVDSEGVILAEFHTHTSEHLSNMQALVNRTLAR